jgi:hypothetical protein
VNPRFSHPWYIRFWRRCITWSVGLDGELVWFSSDGHHHRTRRLDHELRIPRALFKPICWFSKDGHSDYYGFCVVCEKRMSAKRKGKPRFSHRELALIVLAGLIGVVHGLLEMCADVLLERRYMR